MDEAERRALRIEAETYAHSVVLRGLVGRLFAGEGTALGAFREECCGAVESLYGTKFKRHDADLLVQTAIAEIERMLEPPSQEPRQDR
jgi:hypothetical protein